MKNFFTHIHTWVFLFVCFCYDDETSDIIKVCFRGRLRDLLIKLDICECHLQPVVGPGRVTICVWMFNAVVSESVETLCIYVTYTRK